MGIKGLTALISEHAPKAMTDHDIKTMFGRKVAIDASMSLYQFLIAVRQKDGEMLMNEAGEVTSHLMGTFYRTLRMVDHGIKPAYVFDGKPPDLKSGVLKKRFESREKAKEGEEEAKETGTAEDVDRMNRRQVRVTKEQNAECQRLLKLMGIPVILAPGEAEAQAAELARGGKVYAAGSEDMDTMTFNTPILLRHLTFSEAKKAPISEIHLDKVLEGLDLTMDQFIDLCILLGCDYVEPIKGVGPKSALKMIREHGSLKAVVAYLRARTATLKAQQGEEESEEEKTATQVKSEQEDEAEVLDSADELEKPDVTSSPPVKAPGKGKARRVVDSDDEGDSDVSRGLGGGGGEGGGLGSAADSDSGEDEKPAAPASPVKGKGKAKAKAPAKKAPVKKKVSANMTVPDDWPWEEARQLFLKPNVTPAKDVEVEWTLPDVDGLVEFLVREKGFNEERVRSGAARLQKMLNAKQQGRLDGFFKVLPKEGGTAAAPGKKGADDKKPGPKRKGEPKAKAAPAKKPKGDK